MRTPVGVFGSTDRGDSWEAKTAGLRDPVTAAVAAVEAIKLDPRDASTVYAAGGSGLYVSHDGAATWSRLALPQLHGDRAIHGVAVDPASSSRLLAGHAAGILRSTNGGVTWTRPALPQEVPFVAFAFDGHRPGVVYAAGSHGVLRSEDGGKTWSWAGEVQSTALAVDSRGAVYAATWLGVYRSTDRGMTFLPFANAMVGANDLVVLPGRLYAAIDGGGVQTTPLAP